MLNGSAINVSNTSQLTFLKRAQKILFPGMVLIKLFESKIDFVLKRLIGHILIFRSLIGRNYFQY